MARLVPVSRSRRHHTGGHSLWPISAPAPRRRNPTVLGLDVNEAAGTAGGAIATAYLDQAVVQPFGGGLLNGLGRWKPAASAVLSAIGVGILARKLNRGIARQMDNGQALYAGVAIANSLAPGLIPITVGVPKQLDQFRFAALQPPSAQAALPASAAPSTPDQVQRSSMGI